VAITLRIDNFDQLPDGGPVEFSAGARGFDIGRETHLDWTLPDPNRVISGHHGQIRYENGEYWLNDISRNGTYVNGSPGRVKSPYRLANGDRLQIGHYYVSVQIAGGSQPEVAAPDPGGYQPMPAGGDLWSTGDATPQAVDRRWFANQQRGSRAPDMMDQYFELPKSRPSAGESPFGPDAGAGLPMREMPGAPMPQAAQMPQATPIPQAAPMPQSPLGYPPAQPVGYPMQQTGIAPAVPAEGQGGVPQFLAAVASAAGVPPQALVGRRPDEVAAEFGAILRIVTEQLTGLLLARAAAKQMTKSSNRTMIGSENNNPLKFIPDAGEAIEIMFRQNRPGYLSASAAFRQGFEDVKRHEVATYAAMQKALARLMEDLAPDNIEDKVAGSAFGNKKGRAWEIYVERWNAKTEHYENGILDVFLAYFADAYDDAAKR
jgi:type VI secretion system FHA domain protein